MKHGLCLHGECGVAVHLIAQYLNLLPELLAIAPNTRVQQQFSELQLLCERTTYTHRANGCKRVGWRVVQGTWSAVGAGRVQPFTVKKERKKKEKKKTSSGRLHHTEIENELCDGQRLIVRAQLFHCALS